jgi:predicted P-loop ATPase
MSTAPREILMPRVRAFTSAAEAALWYTQQGIFVVPVAYQGKNPRGSDWERLRIDAASIPDYFNGTPQNIGALLGIIANGRVGLADVDLDAPESLAVAPAFLPDTNFIFGRASKPASHPVFFTEPPVRLQQFKDPLDKTMLVELRGLTKTGTVGLQTVLPGSVHHSGELITFESGRDSTPATVAPDDLVRAVHKIAAASLLCRYWPASGRHDTMLALAGTLARADWTVDDALLFCRTLYQAVPTHDPNAVSRVESEVRDSFAKIAADEPATGFPSLTEHIDRKVVETALGWLGIKAQPQIVSAGTGDDWQERLQRTHSGELKGTTFNADLFLRHSPEWQGVLTYNEFSMCIETAQPPPWNAYKREREWDNDDTTSTFLWLQGRGVGISSPMLTLSVVKKIARENPHHPLRRYLTGLVWDGTPRIDTWLHDYLGAENSPLNSAIGARWLIQAVARAMRPGCQADATLLLIGTQGFGKSSALRTLAGDEYFTDHLSDLGSKDSRIELHGRWIIEMSEFTSRRCELERKSFLTATHDSFRPPYEVAAKQVPRSNVFAATSNDDSPLSDATGGRRYWSVSCGVTRPKADIEKLRQDRDMIWGEACKRYLDGEAWYADFSEFRAALAVEQASRFASGAFDEQILPWLQKPTARLFENRVDRAELRFDSEPGKVTILDCLVHACLKAQHEISQRDRMAVRDCLLRAGYHREKPSRISADYVARLYVREGAL